MPSGAQVIVRIPCSNRNLAPFPLCADGAGLLAYAGQMIGMKVFQREEEAMHLCVSRVQEAPVGRLRCGTPNEMTPL